MNGKKLLHLASRSRHWLIIAYRMLRIRTVFVMITFEAIGYEAVKPKQQVSLKFLIVAVMLGLLYICATCFNDAADEEIDKVNLPNDISRPLVTTKTTGKQLQKLGIVALLIAAVSAVLVNTMYLWFIACGTVLNILYSVAPFKISYRGIMASLWLPLSYVVLPFLAGAFLSGENLTRQSWYVLCAMYSCFVGRILLKDFRDYAGDKKFGKLNFLVRHGPKLTCIVSGMAWIIGDGIMITHLYNVFALFVCLIQPLICIILYELYMLSEEKNYQQKLVKVSIIGRLGNAVALGLLTSLTLQAFDYPSFQKNFMILMIIIFIAITANNVSQLLPAKLPVGKR